MPLDMLPPPVAGEEPREQDTKVNAVANVRLLTPEEVSSLAPIFEREGAMMPAAEHSFVVGSVAEDGHVVAFLVIQLKVHAEPMWIEHGHERLFQSLVHVAEKTIAEKVQGGCEVFLFAPAGKIARLAALSGMRPEPWTVWSKFVDAMSVEETPAPKIGPVESVQ
jgi:hypothetical protein